MSDYATIRGHYCGYGEGLKMFVDSTGAQLAQLLIDETLQSLSSPGFRAALNLRVTGQRVKLCN